MIPNVILDVWMKEITGNALSVVLFIARKTFGWHKEKDRVSLSQIIAGTDIKTNHTAIKCCNFLVENGYVFKEDTNQQGTVYGIQVVQKLHHLDNASGAEITLPSSAKNAPEVVQKLHTQNKDKESSSKKNNGVSRSSSSPAAAVGILLLLKAAGIGEPTRSRLSKLPHMTPEFVDAHCAQANKDKVPVNLLIHRLRENDPIPEKERSDAEKYTGGKYGKYVEC